jgi:hypothetical protein
MQEQASHLKLTAQELERQKEFELKKQKRL